jgi:uncharacterized protein YggE
MFDGWEAERTCQGVRVFGSAVIRVAPDIATILVGVSRLEQQPEPAFAAARTAAQSVGAYLQRRGMQDFGSSRITLSQDFRYVNGEQRFVGYAARIGFSVVLRNMDQVEETVTGLIGAGANELTSVTFQTSRLREVRADARRRAIAAAREKAELYCAAAGVVAGGVLAIEDANPEFITGRNESHVHREPVIDDTGEVKAMDPAAISVGAAVHVLYALEASP